MTIDEERIIFASQLGLAIAAWADVENGLRKIVLECFIEEESNLVSVGFFRIAVFRSKLSFADEVVRKKFMGNPIKSDWSKLESRMRKNLKKRNCLVHYYLREFPSNEQGMRIVLTPWVYPKPKSKTAKPSTPEGSLGLLDVVKAKMEFNALAVSLKNYCCRLRGAPEKFPKSRERGGNPPTIQSLARQTREALLPPN